LDATGAHAVTEIAPRPSGLALVASFLFTDLVGFSKRSVSEQFAAKSALAEILRANLAVLRDSDYRIKDTGDGALIAFVANPEHALYMALAIADACGHQGAAVPLVSLRTGVHLGAVKESFDVESRPNYVGDGINAAKRIMDFAAPGQITASRAFFDAVGCLDASYAELFRHLGAPDDKHGRAHELYSLQPSATVLEKLRRDLPARDDVRDVPPGTVRTGYRRTIVAVAAVACAGGAAAYFLFPARKAELAATPPPAIPLEAPSRAPLGGGVGTGDLPGVGGPPAAGAAVAPPATAAPAAVAMPPIPQPDTRTPVSSAERPGASNRGQRAAIAGEGPATAGYLAAPKAAAARADPGVAANDRGSPRCSRIIGKAELGEPLSPEEKKELANACR
jgi:class 3 adenylate cyclase